MNRLARSHPSPGRAWAEGEKGVEFLGDFEREQENMPDISAPTTAAAYTIYRINASPVKITGAALSIDIKDGSLLVSNNGSVVYVFNPNQWATVNFDPKTA
jgi:hypothetical protein